jgi:hypothetical protein
MTMASNCKRLPGRVLTVVASWQGFAQVTSQLQGELSWGDRILGVFLGGIARVPAIKKLGDDLGDGDGLGPRV